MARKNKILVADDDELVLLSLRLLLEQSGNDVVTTSSPERIPALLDNDVQLVLLDMNFRPGDTSSTQGLFWLTKIQEIKPGIPVIMITAFGEIPLAVEAMKKGAYDFVTKPWDNEKLVNAIESALSVKRRNGRSEQATILDHTLDPKVESLIGSSALIDHVRKTIEKVAQTDASILILGANGTGKEVIAKTIHEQSDRKTKAFVSVDVGSLSENIFESEMFGHKKGAFTDAKEDRVGRFEAAHEGTIFLDEIGNLSLSLQSKLLTVLQNKTITRLGSNQAVPVNVRIICATNSDLKKLVVEGKFREDLYYRIKTVEIIAPSLIDRVNDIEELITHFLKKFGSKYGKQNLTIDGAVMDDLKKYRWPGNVRELQHAVERAVILAENARLSLDDFGIVKSQTSGDLIFDHLNLEKLEHWAIKKAIEKHRGNVSHAAEELGLSRGALYRRMEKYGL